MLTRTIAGGVLLCVVAAALAAAIALAAETDTTSDAAPTQMKAMQDTALYYAPDKQIGLLKAGAQVTLVKEQGEWALVKYDDKRITVQGWVQKAHLTPAAATDPLKGVQGQQN
jgi:hypothetical protein